MSSRISTLYISAGLLLVAAFAAAMLLTLSSGARVYRQVDQSAESQYGERAAMSYVAAKLRANDLAGAVALGQIDGCQALVLTRTLDGADYSTYIYCFDGSLRELLCPAGEKHSAGEGEQVLELDSLTFTLDNGLLTAECSLNGRTSRISVCVNTWEAAA